MSKENTDQIIWCQDEKVEFNFDRDNYEIHLEEDEEKLTNFLLAVYTAGYNNESEANTLSRIEKFCNQFYNELFISNSEFEFIVIIPYYDGQKDGGHPYQEEMVSEVW